jgi:hypothetical protein
LQCDLRGSATADPILPPAGAYKPRTDDGFFAPLDGLKLRVEAEVRRIPQSTLLLRMLDSQLGRLPQIAGDARPNFRLMVRASKPGSKLFVWMILQEDHDCIPIMQSSVTFRSLADAHVAGAVALLKYRIHQALSVKQ